MADPIARAINTFAALKGMEYQGQQVERQKRLDEEAREDRLYSRGMQQRAEGRAERTFDLSLETHKENADWNRTQRERQKQEWSEADIAKAREESDNILLAAVKAAEANGGNLDVPSLLTQLEGVKHGLNRKIAALFDPQSVQQQTAATLSLLKQLRTGEYDHAALVQDANLAFADELDARGQKYGAKQVRIDRIVPSPQGDGVMFGVQITRADGSTYRAPMTMNGGTVENGDNEVKVFKMEQVAPYLVGKLQTLQGAKAYLESRGKIEQPKEEWVLGADGQLKLEKYSGRTEKTGYVKPEKGGDGSGGTGSAGHGGKAPSAENYKLFDDQLNKQFLAEFQAALPADQKEMADMMESDAFGNQRVSMERVVAKMPPEMRQRYNAARQAGENFMADGSLAPVLAANKAYQFASQPKGKAAEGGTTESYARIDAKDTAAVQGVAKYLASLPVEEYQAEVQEIRRDNPQLVEALVAQRRAGKPAAAGGKPPTRGMAPAGADSPVDILGQMRSNIPADNPMTRANEYPAQVIQNGLNQLANYFVVDPARAAASDVAKPFKAFQQWAQSRYKSPGAEKNPQALAEYAKVDPQGAQQIQQAIAQLAQ